jgi:hypothetical protein
MRPAAHPRSSQLAPSITQKDDLEKTALELDPRAKTGVRHGRVPPRSWNADLLNPSRLRAVLA